MGDLKRGKTNKNSVKFSRAASYIRYRLPWIRIKTYHNQYFRDILNNMGCLNTDISEYGPKTISFFAVSLVCL